MKDKALANKAKAHFRKREKLKRERENLPLKRWNDRYIRPLRSRCCLGLTHLPGCCSC